MRILHIVEATFAGVGRHVLDLVESQIEAGHELSVAYSPLRQSHDFQQRREPMADVNWHPTPMTRAVGRADYQAWRFLRRLTRAIEPDVIHGHSTKGGLLARSMPKGPWRIIYTPNAVYSLNPQLGPVTRRLVTMAERRLSNRTDLIIAVSAEEEVHLRLNGIDHDKVQVIPNGIAPIERADKAEVRSALNLPADNPILGFVGRLDDQKAPHDLLAVYGRIATERPDPHFVVVGDGPLRAELEESVNPEGPLAGRIHFLGRQPGPWAMSAFDVLVLPSRYEGFPYVLIEAAHLGVPIVATREANPSLLVAGPGLVLTADHGDVDALTQRCYQVLDRPPETVVKPDRRFTLNAMAKLTELGYRGEMIDARAAVATRDRVR